MCFLFQAFSMKSIVSWPLECNFSLCSFFLVGLRSLLYEMVHSPVTLPDICTVFSLLLLFCLCFFFSGKLFCSFSHLVHFIIRLARTLHWSGGMSHTRRPASRGGYDRNDQLQHFHTSGSSSSCPCVSPQAPPAS